MVNHSAMAREPEETPDYKPDLLDYDTLSDADGIIWDDPNSAPYDEGPREFPKAIIYAIVALVIVVPAGIMLSDAFFNGERMLHSSVADSSWELYQADIQKGESNGAIAAVYHDAALINFSRGQYDIAIDQMTRAANYSLQSMGDYQAAVRDSPRDFQGANLSSEGALYMHEAEMRYVEAFKSYRSGDAENASIYWDEAKYYIGLSADHQVIRH